MTYYSSIKINIDGDIQETAKKLIFNAVYDRLIGLGLDQDIDDMADFLSDLWIDNYVNSDATIEAIEKIRSANPPD